MASVAGRKKSIVSTTGLQIDTSANGMLLNQAASQSTSLYQQCSALKARLMRIKGFAHYMHMAAAHDARSSTDPVTQLWDLFSLGIPLCFIFDQLAPHKGFNRINHSAFDDAQFSQSPDRAKKHAIALFAMQIRSGRVMQEIPGCELFTVTDLWDRNSTDGLVKVINTVTAIVNNLPSGAFESPPPSSPAYSENPSFEALEESLAPSPPTNAKEAERINAVREIVETERKFVNDLEIMQKYSNSLAESNVMPQDTIHLLFPGLNKLLNFQRKFLIRLEGIAELPWTEQRWGLPFIENEDEFVVYEPYCANYPNATDIMLSNEQKLSTLNHMIQVKGELPAFLIKPIQRICKYPLLLDKLIGACSSATYPYYEELKAGVAATKRITEKINEAQRRTENEQTVRNLQARIEDWKGHHLENFGQLLLDDVFTVTKSDIDREYHVFLFEKIILCCKEAPPQPGKNGKNAKQNAQKKQAVPPPLILPGSSGKPQNTMPLLLKGRIFLGNVTMAKPVPARGVGATGIPNSYPLAVWWKGDDDLEFFTISCRREDQMRQWEATINRLIREAAMRRASERPTTGLTRIASANVTTTSQRLANQPSIYSTSSANSSTYSHSSQSSSGTVTRSRTYQSGYEDNSVGAGPQGYPPHDGFDMEPDEDDLEDYPPASAVSYSGRGTPVGSRRTPNAQSMPPEQREPIATYDRRAYTEGGDGPNVQQWRNASATAQAPGGAGRPPAQRMNSTMSMSSYASDSSYASAPKPTASRPVLRSQFSSTRLRSAYDSTPNSTSPAPDYRARSGTTATTPTAGAPTLAPPVSRSRSTSQPTPYVPPPKSVPPPLPNIPVHTSSSQWNGRERSVGGIPNGKRGSGSSQSTGESSDYSPNSSSPITPFASSESSLGGVAIRNSRSQTFESLGSGLESELPVKVKVHFHEDIFVIQVPKSTEFGDLVEKVGRKIRLCGPRRDDGPLRVKYRDEDGDMVSLGSTEDVQMAFEQYRPGGQVTLFVT